MLGIGKIIFGSLLFFVALILSFTIIGIFLALPLYTVAFGYMTAGLAELGFKTAKAASKVSRE